MPADGRALVHLMSALYILAFRTITFPVIRFGFQARGLRTLRLIPVTYLELLGMLLRTFNPVKCDHGWTEKMENGATGRLRRLSTLIRQKFSLTGMRCCLPELSVVALGYYCYPRSPVTQRLSQ